MESIAQFWPDFDSVITSAYGHGDEEMVIEYTCIIYAAENILETVKRALL